MEGGVSVLRELDFSVADSEQYNIDLGVTSITGV